MGKINIFFIGSFLVLAVYPVFPFGEPPSVEKNPTVSVMMVEVIDIDAIRQRAQEKLKQNDFEHALDQFIQIPTADRTVFEKQTLKTMILFQKIEESAVTANKSFEEMVEKNEEIISDINRLYFEAQKFFLKEELPKAKDTLLHILTIQKKNFRASKFLELGFGLRSGNYKIENVLNHYLEKSTINFYGGNYLMARDSLELLAILQPKNPLVYQRLGSSYYMMGDKKKAADAWLMALYLEPHNEQIKEVVAKLEAEHSTMDKAEQPGFQKKSEDSLDAQYLGVFRTQEQAYRYAADLKKQGFSVVVDHTKDDRWAVKVPRSELMDDKTKKK